MRRTGFILITFISLSLIHCEDFFSSGSGGVTPQTPSTSSVDDLMVIPLKQEYRLADDYLFDRTKDLRVYALSKTGAAREIPWTLLTLTITGDAVKSTTTTPDDDDETTGGEEDDEGELINGGAVTSGAAAAGNSPAPSALPASDETTTPAAEDDEDKVVLPPITSDNTALTTDFKRTGTANILVEYGKRAAAYPVWVRDNDGSGGSSTSSGDDGTGLEFEIVWPD